ncbi:methionine/alanine import family NSS transporter small subunit [Schaalia vaccimaxillae]|uniref:methionine/alanine import family NSS transporter small subunit n=1 Tax=Schaalia vaccimaxillae TaxID=183916 RepID=UPI0003B47540|nr:methionine/alanine import family NSS transporter small subunit [Schaalia vaccimaxillae]
MSAAAILLMIVTILLVWGGLVASIVLLQVLSVPSDEERNALQAQIDAHPQV